MTADWAGKGYFELINIQRLKYPNLKFEPASYNRQLPVPTNPPGICSLASRTFSLDMSNKAAIGG